MRAHKSRQGLQRAFCILQEGITIGDQDRIRLGKSTGTGNSYGF